RPPGHGPHSNPSSRLKSHSPALRLPSPIYKKRPTLRWGHVQTCERREKGGPQYRVLGSLRVSKDLAFFFVATFSVFCIPVQQYDILVDRCQDKAFLVRKDHVHCPQPFSSPHLFSSALFDRFFCRHPSSTL